MAPTRTVNKVRLHIVGFGGSPTGSEEALISEARTRLRQMPTDVDLITEVEYFVWGIFPICSYLIATCPHDKLRDSPAVKLAKLVYEIFKTVASHTKLVTKYAGLLDSSEGWAMVEDSTGRMLRS